MSLRHPVVSQVLVNERPTSQVSSSLVLAGDAMSN